MERAVCHALRHPPKLTILRSIRRKLAALEICDLTANGGLTVGVLGKIRELKDALLQHRHEAILQRWKNMAREWNTSSRAAFAFVRNPPPSKIGALKVGGIVTSHPRAIERELNDYWSSKESWPTSTPLNLALENLDQFYSFLLPHVPFHAELSVGHLMLALKRAKNSATGLDAWSLLELKLLPSQAWPPLLDIFLHRLPSIMETNTGLAKRVPLEKTPGVCDAAGVRPIDLFSCLLRLFSSAVFNLVRPWAQQVIHPCQFSTNGGTLVATSFLAVRTEMALSYAQLSFAISLDFAKMFNSLSGEVAGSAARVMGLSSGLVELLVAPLRGCIIRMATSLWGGTYGHAPPEGTAPGHGR